MKHILLLFLIFQVIPAAEKAVMDIEAELKKQHVNVVVLENDTRIIKADLIGGRMQKVFLFPNFEKVGSDNFIFIMSGVGKIDDANILKMALAENAKTLSGTWMMIDDGVLAYKMLVPNDGNIQTFAKYLFTVARKADSIEKDVLGVDKN